MSQFHTLRSPHVFISFKTEERETAFALKTALEHGGFSVWWQEDIQCGREWHGDIDIALAKAGCVLVLWSEASIKSPWVRHEASQAIARGIYTPVRLVPIAIGSPFDRLQATDLFGWTPGNNHPGLIRLLQRIDELIPQPLSRTRQLLVACYRNRIAIVSLVVAVAAMAMLIHLSVGLENQLKAQSEIVKAMKHIVDPLDSFHVVAQIIVNPTTPGISEYLSGLRKSIAVSSQTQLSKGTMLPNGISTSIEDSSGSIMEVQILRHSPFWPKDTDSAKLGTVLSHLSLLISFSASERKDPTPSNDLSFLVSSHEDSEQEGVNPPSIRWNLKTDEIVVTFSDDPPRKWWDRTGQIQSVRDMESSMLTVEIDGRFYPGDSETDKKQIEAARHLLALKSLILSYAGRTVYINGAKLQPGRGTKNMPLYRGQFLTATQRE